MAPGEANRAPLGIAVGVLIDGAGRWLVARRRAKTIGAGYWEFPGGKIEAGESVETALTRELDEEIGVRVLASRPLIRFVHSRGPRPVCLYVHRVTDWQGSAYGREGQALDWVPRAQLDTRDLLPATDIIINAATLPREMAITPDRDDLSMIERSAIDARQCPRLIRVRAPQKNDAAYAEYAARVISNTRPSGCRILLDRDPAMVERLGADGLQWPAARLRAHAGRPVAKHRLFGVSAHDGADLARATGVGADFATLSPVKATATHPDLQPLGWTRWAAERADHAVCVYALGGLAPDDWPPACGHNAQGIAGIRGFGGGD